MKKVYDKLKLNFKEQLRIIGKVDINPGNDYLVKRRKYVDIDIQKDFEKRLRQKTSEDMKEIIEEQSLNLDKMTFEEIEELQRNKLIKEEEDKQSDLYSKVIVRDEKKLFVLAVIRAHEFYEKLFDDKKLHPRMKKNLEIIEYHLNYNLPVEKRLLFETVPELFREEIGQLTNDERKMFRLRRLEFVASDGILKTGEQFQNRCNVLMESYSDDKILEMKYYLHFQNKKFFAKYSRFLSQAVKWGWDSIPLYLESLNIKDPLKLTFGEKLMKRELDEMEHIKQEIMTLEKSEEMKGIEIELPFPMEGKFKEEFINYSKYLLKHRVVDIRDTYLIPYQFPEESFMDRVNKIPGIQAEIKLSNEKIKGMIDKGLPMKEVNLASKDPEIVRKINIVSQAVKVEEPYYKKNENLNYVIPANYIEETLLGNDPSPGRILIEEYYKVLYLNNQDPEKYNFAYWEKYFGVKTKTLRNIFNYVFFPIPDESNPTEVGKILYFQDIEYEKRRKLIKEMTGEEYNEYLAHTEERPELDEVTRLEYLTHQTAATEPRVTDRTILTDYVEEDRNMDKVLINSPVIKAIDEKISQLVSGQLDYLAKENLIDKDVQEQIDELKVKRIEYENQQKKIKEEGNIKRELTKEEIENKLYNTKAIKHKEDDEVEIIQDDKEK